MDSSSNSFSSVITVPAALFMPPLLHRSFLIRPIPALPPPRPPLRQPRSWPINPIHEFNILFLTVFQVLRSCTTNPPWATAWWSHSWNRPHTMWPHPSLQTCSYWRAFTLTLQNPSVLLAFLPLLSHPRRKRDPCAWWSRLLGALIQVTTQVLPHAQAPRPMRPHRWSLAGRLHPEGADTIPLVARRGCCA